jgi:hypothetical protein
VIGRHRGWRLLRGNPRAAAPGALAPPRQPLWAGPNTYAGGGPAAPPMINTITIL